MPNRKQKDCSKGKIYFVRSNNPEIKSKYVGSTIQTLAQRMSGHRSGYKEWLKGTGSSCAIYYEFQKYGIEQFHIELIEDYPCEREEQLLARENVFIRQEECVNKNMAITTHEELRTYKTKWAKDNPESSKKYFELHKEKIQEYQKQYAQTHKDEKKINDKRYYQEHSAELKEIITCVCGCQITKQSLTRHLKTNKHKAFIAFSI